MNLYSISISAVDVMYFSAMLAGVLVVAVAHRHHMIVVSARRAIRAAVHLTSCSAEHILCATVVALHSVISLVVAKPAI